MYRPRVVIQPCRELTRLWASRGNSELMRAVLPAAGAAHPRAAATLLEGLSLWTQSTLSVVVCADDLDRSSALGLCDGFGLGDQTAHYAVEVLEKGRRRGLGRFADLRQLTMRFGDGR